MTPLVEILLTRIRSTGPLNMAEFMTECLLHPKYGYYSTRDPFGEAGDFTTAPEISQMFGELLGLALAQAWIDQGCPNPFVLAELGPGRGTLMADVMRATAIVPGFHAAARVHLLEASEHLQKLQAKSLSAYTVTWLDQIDALPQAPLFLLANEFFDALPIRQFTRHRDGWQEHLIAERQGQLTKGLSEPGLVVDIEHRLPDTKPGEIVELCTSAMSIMGEIADRIKGYGGAAIVVDYGNWQSLGDTFQAVRSHRFEDPLINPGGADITAHVDFSALVAAAPGVSASMLTGQGALLSQLGIVERHAALARDLTGPALCQHDAALTRLTDAEEMGTLFKAIAFFPKNGPQPPGFAP